MEDSQFVYNGNRTFPFIHHLMLYTHGEMIKHEFASSRKDSSKYSLIETTWKKAKKWIVEVTANNPFFYTLHNESFQVSLSQCFSSRISTKQISLIITSFHPYVQPAFSPIH